MKSIVKQSQETNKYPYLGILRGNSLIILFTSPRSGVVISSGDTSNKLGFNYNDWEESLYLPFNGEVTLKNS